MGKAGRYIMKAYANITCEELIDVIKEVFDVSNVKEKRREYVVPISVCGFPLRVHIYKDDPKDWRVTGFNPIGDGWDEMLTAVHAISEELDRHYC